MQSANLSKTEMKNVKLTEVGNGKHLISNTFDTFFLDSTHATSTLFC